MAVVVPTALGHPRALIDRHAASRRISISFARVLRLNQFLKDEFDVDIFEKAVRQATRPNGSLNVVGLLRNLEGVAAMQLAKRDLAPASRS